VKPLHAVILEDDENDLLLISEELERCGFALRREWVKSAAELRRALEGGCDVVLADYRLPHFSGRDALELVRSMGLDVPFILVTATLGDELAVDMMRRGADDYVLKDRMARLGYAIERALREHAERRERSSAQHALAAVQRRFQETFEHAPLGIVHVAEGGRFSLVNDFFCTMLGYSREELTGMTFLDLTHPDDRGRSMAQWKEMSGGTTEVYRAEKRYVRKDDAIIWVSVVATAVRTASGAMDYAIGMVQEITARKEAEEKIRVQSVLLDAVEQAVIATDREGYITCWSRYAQQLYGWSETDVLGRHVLDVTMPGISAEEAAVILGRRRRGVSWSGEATVTARNGRTFPAMIIDSPILNVDGAVAGTVGVSFDLTEQKASAEALRRSEERYRGIIEGVVEPIVSVNADGKVATVNRAFEAATGWTRTEIVGRPVWELMPASNVESAAERLAARLREDREDLNIVTGEMLRRDGSAMIVDGVAYVARERSGEPEVFYFLRDITARTRAEEERARIDRQFRLVLESTDEGIYAVDANGICTMINRAAQQVLGFPPEELIGRRIHDIVHFAHADGTPFALENCPVFRSVQCGTKERIRDQVFWRRDGTAVPVEYATAPILEDGTIIGAVTTFTDVSRRRMLESQLEKANRLNGLGRIAATIAHEFNNVLMGIQRFAEILRIQAEGHESMTRSVDIVASCVQRGKRVTSEILQFTRQSEPVKSRLDVTSWLDDLAAEARQVLGDAITMIVHAASGLSIVGDSAALQQVFMNMVVNARDALNGNGLLVIAARPSEESVFPFGVVEHGDRFAHFTVTDDGPGIPAETMQHIFEPLFTTKKNGTGIGLALAHHVVQAHGGSIFVESAEGAGTTFHLFLPLAEPDVRHEPVRQPVFAPSPVRSLVLVEDDPTVAIGMTELLALDDVTVHVAVTGAEAEGLIEKARPDAVVLDVSLPDMDGTIVYETIARRWPSLPVVFATGHLDASHLRAYLARENVRYVLKPYRLEALYEALANSRAAG
jgi:PAS domain S-box-containing protein